MPLRSAAGPAAIAALRRALPSAVIGAGTVVSATQFAQAVDAGSQFVVAPGFAPELAAAARRLGVPLLPGVVTPSELMAAVAEGIDTLKLFPAEPAGGIALLKAFAAPFPDVAFCRPAASRWIARPTTSPSRTCCASECPRS